MAQSFSGMYHILNSMFYTLPLGTECDNMAYMLNDAIYQLNLPSKETDRLWKYSEAIRGKTDKERIIALIRCTNTIAMHDTSIAPIDKQLLETKAENILNEPSELAALDYFSTYMLYTGSLTVKDYTKIQTLISEIDEKPKEEINKIFALAKAKLMLCNNHPTFTLKEVTKLSEETESLQKMSGDQLSQALSLSEVNMANLAIKYVFDKTPQSNAFPIVRVTIPWWVWLVGGFLAIGSLYTFLHH